MIFKLVHVHHISKVLFPYILQCHSILDIALHHLTVHLVKSVELPAVPVDQLQVHNRTLFHSLILIGSPDERVQFVNILRA